MARCRTCVGGMRLPRGYLSWWKLAVRQRLRMRCVSAHLPGHCACNSRCVMWRSVQLMHWHVLMVNHFSVFRLK